MKDVLELVNELVIPLEDLQKKLADIPAAIEETRAAAKAEGYTEGFDAGVASVPVKAPVDTTPAADGTYTKEQVEQMIADAIAALPADTTPFSKEEMDAVTAELEAVKAELALVKSDDEADKATIATATAKIEKLTAKIEAFKALANDEV